MRGVALNANVHVSKGMNPGYENKNRIKNMSLNIEAQISGKPWLAKVTGSNAKFGTESEFLTPTKRISNRLAKYTITEPGVYKHEPREATIGNMRRDTGYVRIDDAGGITEISEEEAKKHALNLDAEKPQEVVYENDPFARFSSSQMLAELKRRGLNVQVI